MLSRCCGSSALGRPVTLRVPLAVAVQAEAEEEQRLTEKQYRLLRKIDRQHEVVIAVDGLVDRVDAADTRAVIILAYSTARRRSWE